MGLLTAIDQRQAATAAVITSAALRQDAVVPSGTGVRRVDGQRRHIAEAVSAHPHVQVR